MADGAPVLPRSSRSASPLAIVGLSSATGLTGTRPRS